MASNDLRKFMNLMESSSLEEENTLDEEIQYDSLSRTLWAIYTLGTERNENEAGSVISDLIKDIRYKSESVMETGNANAQQKGIHFDGKPASKNSGDMDQSSPKSKSSGGKTSLAQQKAGTNVGKIKS